MTLRREGTELTVVPFTGEALQLADLSYEQLAEVLASCRDWEREQLQSFKADVQAEVLRRMDERAATGETGAWTIREGDWKLTGDSPDRTEYPVDELREALAELAEDGLISPAAVDKVIVPSGWKVAKRALTQLMKIPGVADRVREVERPVDRPRRVTVTWERR